MKTAGKNQKNEKNEKAEKKDPVIVKTVRSDELYEKILQTPPDRKDDVYRYDFMQLFEKKWELYHIPLKAKKPGGYDIVMASDMLGYLVPKKIDQSSVQYIEQLKDDAFWKRCTDSVKKSLKFFEDAGLDLPVREYMLTVMLGNPESPYSKMCDGYSGDGGIPGFIFGSMVPSPFTKERLPAALAHETGHNVRFQFVAWSNDLTLGEYLVDEGLAENFSALTCGRESVGAWVRKTDSETLNDYIKPLMLDALETKGFENISAYMYGDELAALQGWIPVGMPYCAGYACGYYLVKYFLEKTGVGIAEATIMPAEEILSAVKDFWTEHTATDEVLV